MKGGNIQPKPFVDSPLNYSNIKTWPGVSTSHGGNHYEYNEYNNDPQLQMKYEGFVGGYVWNKKRRSKKNKKNKNSTRGKSSNRQYLGGGAFPIISDAALYLKSGMNSIGNIPKILTGNPVNPSVMPWNGQFKQFLNK
jgi:hypothetical protein